MKLPSPIPDPDARLRGEALDWFIRRSGDEWTARDEAAFAAWLNADSAHRRTFARWEAHWQALDKLPPMAVARLRAAPSESRNAPVDSGGEAPVWGRWPASPALLPPLRRRSLAIGLAALGLVAGAFAYHHQYVDPVFSQVIATPRGGSLSARLPDGTGIEIDTATRLQVTYQRGRRLIALAEGQALFSVQPDSGRPFIVTAGSVRVRVVGTRFSVRHTPEIPGEPGVAVAVDEGRVRVEPERGIAGVWLGALGWRPGGTLLSAGERLVTGADGTPGPVTPLPEAGIASWREDRVSFVDAPLGQALAEFQRYGDTDLSIADPQVAALRLSGTFDPRDSATFRRVLPRALPVRLQTRGGRTEILLND